ncbi:MAG: glycosyltransferase [Clostridia bacterium]|nr:glycosyltransferase [Clostridia bacterium]NCC76106.1 glycosyltransferase [Clostridia bacterium]
MKAPAFGAFSTFGTFSTKMRRAARALRRVISILVRQGPRILFVKLSNRWRRMNYRHVFAANLQQTESTPAAGETKQSRSATSASVNPASDAPASPPLLFSVIVPLYNTQPDHLAAMIASVQAQTYPHWQLCLADGSDQYQVQTEVARLAAQDSRISYQRLAGNQGISGNTNAALAMASGDYIALLDHDDLLAPHALAEVHRVIIGQGADLIYSDEMNFSGEIGQVSLIHFKPDFAPDNLLSNNYICHLTVFSRALSDTLGGFNPACDGSQDYDYILRLSEQARRIVHIPQILYYWRIHGGSVASDISVKPYCLDAARLALANHLERTGQSGTVENNTILSTYRIRYPLPQDMRALVFVLVHHHRDLQDLKRLLRHPAGLPVRWIFLVSTDLRTDPAARAQLAQRWEQDIAAAGLIGTVALISPGESAPALINQLARSADEPVLAFLSGTIQSMSPGWLTELAQHALRRDIGLATGTIIHRGLICQAGLATGIAGSLAGYHAGRVDGEPGYMARLSFVNNISAADQTLMAVSRAHFLAVAGLDERYQTDLFDLDLAFRLSQQGLRHVFTPYATAAIRDAHQLTVERLDRKTANPSDLKHFHLIWQDKIALPDPYYNPNFNQNHARFDQR